MKNREFYKDGVPHGIHIDYDCSGNVLKKVTFDYGKEYDENGIAKNGTYKLPESIVSYKNGYRTSHTSTYPNGKKSITYYHKGLVLGSTLFNKDGDVIRLKESSKKHKTAKSINHTNKNMGINSKGIIKEIKPLEISIKNKHFGIDWKSNYPLKEITRIELYFSVNRGNTWKLFNIYSPTLKQLPVKVTENGTYCFITRALSTTTSEPKPNDSTTPKLIVHIKSE